MPQAFDITTTTPTVKLSASGEGELAFTVSNALRREVRGRIVPQPEGKAEASWLSIKGATEVDFAADGTHQVTVKIKAPAGTPEGTYGCHLLVSAVTNPDEEYATGPTVSFAVPSASPQRPFPWWIVALVAGVLVVGGGAVALVLALKGGPGLNDPCDPAASECPKELTCAADRGVCLAVEGGACARAEDCVTGRCDAGKCAFPLPGAACKADGSCPPDQECTTRAADSSKVCLLSLGQACTQSQDCATELCEGNKCVVPPPPPGANCQRDGDCPSTQRCVEVTTGSKSCLLRPTEACTRDLDCSSFWCLPDQKVCSRDDGKCQSNAECRPPAFACAGGSCRKVDAQACAGDAECVSGFCDRTCKTSPPCVPACKSGQFCIRGQCGPLVILQPPIFRFEPAQPIRPIPILPSSTPSLPGRITPRAIDGSRSTRPLSR